MLNIIIHKAGHATILRCEGQIVIGDNSAILRNVVLAQGDARFLVLDLAGVSRVDASGLGLLLGLRQWAFSNAIRFKLINVMNNVLQVLELTKLDRVFEFCSVEDMLQLMHCAEARMSSSVDRWKSRDTTVLFKRASRTQEAQVAMKGNSLLVAAP